MLDKDRRWGVSSGKRRGCGRVGEVVHHSVDVLAENVRKQKHFGKNPGESFLRVLR